jgi:aminoglycoside phosphotransferase (APT) family kinase protein
MQYAAEHGYPVPAVHELRADGTELVMERVRGPIMADAILKAIWTLPRAATTLADLHDRLHAIDGREWMRDAGDGGTQLVHLDLHPLNIILDPARGPVVIDWANGQRGEPLSDVGVTYVLLTCPRLPGPRALQIAAHPARLALAHAFARRYRGPAFDAHLARAAELKALDRNMDPHEVEACLRLARRVRAKTKKAVG